MTRISSLLLIFALWSCAVGCARSDGPVKPDDPDAPQVNSTPRQSVRIFGTIAPELEVKLVASYEANSSAVECFTDAPMWKGGGEKFKNERLQLKRDGDRYETTLVVDKYLSGHCQWRMIAVEATVGDKALQTMGMGTVIEGRHFDEDDNAPRCSSDAPRCTEERARRLGNSDESIPVQMRCDTARRAWQDVPGGRTWDNLCDDPFDDSYKTKHLLKPHTRQVELNFIAQALKQSRDETIPNNDAISSAKEPAP